MKNTRTSIIIVLTVLITIALSCTTEHREQGENNTYYLLTQLGRDTLAIEQIDHVGDSIMATVVLRSPKVRISTYGFSTKNGDGVILRGVTVDGITNEVVSTQMATRVGDSLRISLNSGDREKTIAASPAILPFIDMVHWPFDKMLKNGYTNDGVYKQQLWSGTRSFDFEVARIGDDSMTLKHPSRGYMGVSVNENGELVKLDASQTTRKLTVTRLPSLDMEELKAKFIAAERAGKSFGALSGRGKVDKEVNGVNYTVDFGTPSKRGRAIWGNLVKYGDRWRTGANRATHFSTDLAIKLGDLEIPAGEYTFFSIPSENTLTLIVNKQTGQNGRTYDPSQDLGQVELQARQLDELVEVFTIDILERSDRTILSLQWDRKAYEVEITH